MKRFLLACLTTLLSVATWANGTEVDGIYYTFSGSEATVTYTGSSTSGSNDYDGAIIIPSEVVYSGTTYTVTAIGDYAFHGQSTASRYSTVSSVTIPESVTKIGNYAFQYNSALKEIVIPNTVTSIGTYLFRSCTALETATLPSQLQSIPTYAFYGCEALTKVTYHGADDSDEAEAVQISETVNAINEYAFRGCSSLTGPLTLPSTMNYIDAGAFYQCTGLTSVTVEASDNPLYVENSVNYSPFYQCNGLEIVYLYRDCENVKSVNNSTSHNYGLFRLATSSSSSTGMKTIYIGKDVTKISPYCFHTNHLVEKVIFEEGSKLETIDNYAFYNSVGYGSGNSTAVVEGSTVYIPNSVKEIGQYAFYQDYGLEGVVLSEDSQLETIDGYSFAYCKYITEFTIPHNVTSIGANVWVQCSSLKKIHLLNPDPASVVSNDFSSDGDMDWPLVIYVPYGSEKAYEQSTWGTNVVYNNSYLGKIIFNSSVVEIDALDASGEEDYASYYHPYALTIPEGVKAYAISSFDSDGTLTMTEVTDVIPQHSAVLLERDASSETSSYRIYIAEDDEHTAISSNLLYGSEESTTTSVDGVTDGYYFYGLTTKNGENLGFYWGAENGAAFTIPANKAWLALPSAEVANISYLKLKKDGNTTGIESIEAAETANNGAIYTLQGVRVSDMSQKGIYIMNGKKVLVK